MMLGMWNGNVAKGEGGENEVSTEGSKDCQQIKYVKININGPVAGKTLATTASIESASIESSTVENISQTNQEIVNVSEENALVETVTIENIKWFKEKDQLISKGEKADYYTAYTVEMVLIPGENYQFKNISELAIKVNDNIVNSENIILNKQTGEITVRYTFDKTKKGLIYNVSIVIPNLVAEKEFPKPTVCQTDTDKVEIVKDGGISWKNENNEEVDDKRKVDYDTKYKVCIQLQAKEKYEFGDTITIMIGEKLLKGGLKDGIVTVCYDFTRTSKESIHNVDIETISKPIPQEKLVSQESVKITKGKVSVQNVEWKDINNEDAKPEIADYDTEYEVFVTLKAEDKCQFAGNLRVTIGNSEVDLVTRSQDNMTVTVSKRFEKTEKKLVEDVKIKEIPSPQAGQVLVDTASTEMEQEAGVEKVEWMRINKNNKEPVGKGEIADYDTEYEVVITLKAGDKCWFDEDLQVTIGGLAGTVSSNNGDTVTVSYTFPKTQIKPIPKADQSILPTPPTYTLTLNLNKGTLSQQLTIHFTADEISKLSLPTPTCKGYKFIGWYDGKNRIEKITEAKDITLKAQWIKGSIDLKYQSVLTWSKYLDPDVKLTKITIEKKYTKHVKINQKKGTMEGKKYVKKAKVTLTINGKKVDVTVKRLSPKPKVKIVKAGKRIPYVIGIYRTFKLSYKYESGATRAVAEYSYKKKRGFKKCVKALNTLKGGSVSVKKGRTVYFRVTIYYGKWKSPKSELTVLKG